MGEGLDHTKYGHCLQTNDPLSRLNFDNVNSPSFVLLFRFVSNLFRFFVGYMCSCSETGADTSKKEVDS